MRKTEHIDRFLDEIAETLDLDRSTLFLESEIQTAKKPGHGPSVGPGYVDDDCIVDRVRYPGNEKFPSHWYDSLMPFHVEHRVIQVQTKGETEAARTLYSFQHHPFPGNCKIGINRWVQTHGSGWTDDLRKAGLRFRAAVAKKFARCSLLVISTGKSFSGAEPMEEYQELFKGTGRGLYLLNLTEYPLN